MQILYHNLHKKSKLYFIIYILDIMEYNICYKSERGFYMTIIENIGLTRILLYILAINLIAFAAMGIDKWKAKRGAWRIPEQTLLSLVLLGGGIGGIAGMYMFRHKTKKPRFFIGFPVILISEIVLAIYLLIKY